MRITFAALALAITGFTTITSATPGGLDGNGCHNSKKAGYHCHRARSPQPAAKSASSPTATPTTAPASSPPNEPDR